MQAAIEYTMKNFEAAKEALTDMPPRGEEELDPVSACPCVCVGGEVNLPGHCFEMYTQHSVQVSTCIKHRSEYLAAVSSTLTRTRRSTATAHCSTEAQRACSPALLAGGVERPQQVASVYLSMAAQLQPYCPWHYS